MTTGQGRPRSRKTVQSTEGGEGKDKRERIIVVVRSPRQENYPANAHPSAHKLVLESANPAWTRSVRLDALDQPRRQQPVSRTADPEVVKQDKSSGALLTPPKHVRTHRGSRVRMSSGERPIGAPLLAAQGKQSATLREVVSAIRMCKKLGTLVHWIVCCTADWAYNPPPPRHMWPTQACSGAWRRATPVST